MNGFLSAAQPIVKQMIADDGYYDPELPANLVRTAVVTLLSRKPGCKSNENSNTVTIENGYSMWEGKRVKNFKKFSKVCVF